MKVNKMDTDGNGNILIQDISSSYICITKIPKRVETILKDINHWIDVQSKANIFPIIVISATQTSLNKTEVIQPDYLMKRYGTEPSDWKPYHDEENISALLTEYHHQSGYRVEAYFVNSIGQLNKRSEMLIKLKIRKSTVLIVDGISLINKENEAFAKLYDTDEIGGWIYPICENYSQEISEYLKNIRDRVFEDNIYCINNIFDISLIHIDQGCSTKTSLYRKLTDIANKHLSIKHEIDYGISDAKKIILKETRSAL